MSTGNNSNPLADDLDHVLLHTEGLWNAIRGERLFITGGTGFFGTWILESFLWANEKLNLGASATVLTRNMTAFEQKFPHIASHPSLHFHHGDVRDFDFPEGEYSHIIHAATDSIARLNIENPCLMFDSIVKGTRRALDFAVRCKAKSFLLTSSGAVYGKQPEDCSHISEEHPGAPDTMNPISAYSEGKRAAELLCAIYSKQQGLEAKIARCFSFVGPYLPLDIHYAAGNFIRDGLNGGPIIVSGDGTPYRSYLYAADLVIWLWTILFKAQSRIAYNVGSERQIGISELADMVAEHFKAHVKVLVKGKADPSRPPDRYVPSTKRAQKHLGLKQIIGLEDALERTIDFYRKDERRE